MWIKGGKSCRISHPIRTFTIFALNTGWLLTFSHRHKEFGQQVKSRTDRLAIAAALSNRFSLSGIFRCRLPDMLLKSLQSQVRNINSGSSCGPLLRTCGPGYEFA